MNTHQSSNNTNDDQADEEKVIYNRRPRFKNRFQREHEQAIADWFQAGSVLDEKSGIIPLEVLINEAISKLPLNAPAVDPDILLKGWRAAAGDFISMNANLESIVNGVATIKVLQPAMRYHLKQWESALLEKLRQQFGNDMVNTIKYEIG